MLLLQTSEKVWVHLILVELIELIATRIMATCKAGSKRYSKKTTVYNALLHLDRRYVTSNISVTKQHYKSTHGCIVYFCKELQISPFLHPNVVKVT